MEESGPKVGQSGTEMGQSGTKMGQSGTEMDGRAPKWREMALK